VQYRQDFIKSMINTLKAGADNLTLADTNEEAANLTTLQTQNQNSTTALALANQQKNQVLHLFPQLWFHGNKDGGAQSPAVFF
jgi:flagellin